MRMRLRGWQPVEHGGTLRGFATVELPCGLVIAGVAVQVSGWEPSAATPTSIRWPKPYLARVFSDAVITLICRHYADAFARPRARR
jgi:hypothetical protein